MNEQPIRVLLIEGDQSDTALVRAWLDEMGGYRVDLDWAEDRAGAELAIARGDHDVVLLDYVLSDANGLELLQIAHDQNAAPVIMLTGAEEHEIDVAATKAGAFDYLVKRHINAPLLERSIRYAVERFRVEAAWRKALTENNRLAEAINNLTTGVIVCDPAQKDTPIIFANPAFTAMTGFAREEVIGRNCRFLQGWQTDPKTVQEMRDALAAKRPYKGLLVNYRKGGAPFWNEVRISPLYENGVLLNWVGLLDDVSARVESEEDSRRLVRELAERVKELTAVHAAALLLQNDQIPLDELLGQVVNLIPSGFQFPDAIGAHLQLQGREYSTPNWMCDGAPEEYSLSRDFHLSDKSSGSLEVCYSIAPTQIEVFSSEERAMLDSILEMLRSRLEQDLAAAALQKANEELELRVAERTSELEQQRQELRNSAERLRRMNQEILELSQLKIPQHPDLNLLMQAFTEAATRSMEIERASVWLFEEDRTILKCLDLFDARVKIHEGGAISQAVDYPLVFDLDGKERVLAIDDAAHDPRVAMFYKKDLEPIGVASLIYAPILQGGEIAGIFALSHLETTRPWTLEDQTYAGSLADLIALVIEAVEHRQTEDSLHAAKEDAEAAREEAESANLAKSEFLSRMSHELRTPLNSILGFGQLLQGDTLSTQQHQRVDLIVTAGQHLLKLINEVLDIARVEARGLTLSIEAVDAGEVVAETISLVSPLAEKHNISIANEMTGNEKTDGEADFSRSHFGIHFVMADRQKLQQVMLNLFSNAIKYNHDGGSVRVWCEETPDHHLQISVANTGPGIAPADLPRAFVAFERLGAGNGEIEGTGLGLALAANLTQALNGTLEARSTPGVETVFTLSLPITSNPVHALKEIDARPAPGVLLPTTRVLYIEDNLANLNLIESIFEDQENIVLITAMQAGLGLELAREHRPDIVLLDLHLPDMDGEEVLARLKSYDETKDTPVLVLSADATPRRVENLRALGAYDYLKKPLDIAQFLKTMSEIIKAKGKR